jgi:hypothetical protein
MKVCNCVHPSLDKKIGEVSMAFSCLGVATGRDALDIVSRAGGYSLA